jgi:hypothetical protein
VKEIGRKEKNWAKKRAKKSLGRGIGCVFGSSPNWHIGGCWFTPAE